MNFKTEDEEHFWNLFFNLKNKDNKKDIPMKPRSEFNGVITKEKCPVCGVSLFPRVERCEYCKQMIDWTD